MRRYEKIVISLFGVLMVGCHANSQRSPDEGLINTELVSSLNDIQVQNAIICQHSLFPSHFVQDGVEFNELGQRDFATLAGHFVTHAGQLNIMRNNTAAGFYSARVQMVTDKLRQAGVGAERVRVTDGMPGGSGMTSEKILIILANVSTSAPAQMTTGNIGVSR